MAESPPFRVECRAGRLLEARVFRLRTPADAEEYTRQLVALATKVPAGARPVLCADHRPVMIYTQEVAKRLGELFREMNARLERAAIVVARSNATLLLQLDRLAREASFPNRRVFLGPDETLGFLAGSLDRAEMDRATAFLAEHKE